MYALILNGGDYTNTTIFNDIEKGKETFAESIKDEIYECVILLKIEFGEEFGIGTCYEYYGGEEVAYWNIEEGLRDGEE